MMVTQWRGRTAFAGLLLALAALGPARALAECSVDYMGLASVNELSDKDQFIEVKILSADVHASTYSDWSLDFCSTDGKNNPTVECAFNLPLSGTGINTSGEPWLVRTGLGGASVDLAGMDVRLKDASGRTIDYVRVGPGAGDSRIPDAACGADELPYDTHLPSVSGQAGQFARRLPDGTGDWSMATGASDGKSTETDTNDEDATGPAINIYGDSVFTGGTARFRIALPEGTSAAQDILIQYQTEDRTAVSPDDYAATKGSVVLAAGSSSVSVPVSTLADGDRETERFWLRITDVSFGILSSEIGVGEIWPGATALWRFEQNPEDGSGNGLDGNVSGDFFYSDNTPAISGSPGTCHYGGLPNGFFQYGRFTVADNNLLDLPEALTIAAWVRRDESGSGYILSKGGNYQWAAGSDGSLHWLWQGGSLETGSGILPRGVWAHVAVTYRDGEQVIYINGQARARGAATGSLATNSQDLMLGREYYRDIWGPGTRFDGAVDELHIYSDALPEEAVRRIFELTFPCDGEVVLGRLEVTAPPTASVCAPTTVDVTAYDNNGNIFSAYGGTVLLSTSSNHGRWSRGEASGILSPEPDTTDDGSASYQFVAEDGGDARLAFANTHADVLTFSAVDQETGISTTSDPITFAENTLYIQNADSLGDDLIAGRVHSYQISMLKQDPDSGECGVAADYDGTVGLKAWLDRAGDDPGGQAPVLSSTEASVPVPDTAPSDTNFDVIFNEGIGGVTFTSSDVGRYTLNLRDDNSGFVQDLNGAPLPIVSASEAAPWTARPFAVAVEVPGNPGAGDASGPVFQAAGTEFSLRVGGALYDSTDDADSDGVADDGANLMNNGFAPTFGRDGEQVLLSAELLAPASGDNPGLGGPELQASDFSGGVAAPTGFVFTEVGIIDIAGIIEDGSYLGAGSARTGRIAGTSGAVGRFVPDHFTVEVDDPGTIGVACDVGGFTYSGQNAAWAVTPVVQVVPRNLAGSETRNYLMGDFMRLMASGVARTWPSADNSALLADDVTPYPVSVEAADGAIDNRADGEPILFRYSAADAIQYTKTPEAIVAPFAPSLTFEIEGIVDQDSVAALTTGPGSVPLALTPTTSGDVYYGRRTLENVYGPETADSLSMPLYMEYWTGTGFALNEEDNCTGWSADADLQDPEQYHSLTSRGDSGKFTDGLAGPLKLKPTGERGEDELVWEGLSVWQQHDWDGDGSLEGPSATATFGVYRGHDRIIYWREVLN